MDGPPSIDVRHACRLGAAADDIEALEQTLGGPLGMERIFHAGEEWPDRRELRAARRGRVPFATFKSFEGDIRYTWPEVAAGVFDAKLRRIAEGVRALGRTIYLDYHAEPEAEEGLFGSRDDYVRAFRHIVGLFRDEEVHNLRWGWCLMGLRFEDPAAADSWYPGDEHVDLIAADAYNWAGCTESPDGLAGRGVWTSFASRFAAAVEYASVRGKGFVAGEIGCPEDPRDPDRKARWITEMGSYVKLEPRVRGLCWFHHGRSDGFRCDWWIDSSPRSLRAFRGLMADPSFWAPRSARIGGNLMQPS